MHKSHGFSLFEVLLASSLSSIILLAMVNLFIWSEKNILKQQSILSAINKIRFINYYLQQAVAKGTLEFTTQDSIQLKTQSGDRILFYLAKAYIHGRQIQSPYALFQTINAGRRFELMRPVYKMKVQAQQNSLKIAFSLRSDKKISPQGYAYYNWVLTLPRRQRATS